MAKKKKTEAITTENTEVKAVETKTTTPKVKKSVRLREKPKGVVGFLINRTRQNQFVEYGKDKIMLSPNDRFPKNVNKYNLIQQDLIKGSLPKGVVFYPKN